jgi:hypothetical protein
MPSPPVSGTVAQVLLAPAGRIGKVDARRYLGQRT